MKFKQLIPPVFMNVAQKLKRLQRTHYMVGNYEIKIPANLALPDLQKEFRLYDRFLPVLASNLTGPKVIIDIGANIGDTAIAIIEQCNNPIICFEPSDIFYPYLTQNIAKLPTEEKSRVQIIKKFVGTGHLNGTLVHSDGGTANIVVSADNSTLTHQQLDEILPEGTDTILIKVDTDGFDFDVLISANRILTESEPVLYWENQIDHDYQMKGYQDLYDRLSEKGYSHIYIFDIFGNLLLEKTNFKTLSGLNEYIFSMKQQGIARTIHYTDVLAATDKNFTIVDKAVSDYKKNWINPR